MLRILSDNIIIVLALEVSKVHVLCTIKIARKGINQETLGCHTGSTKYVFFWKILEIKLLNIFSNFFFYLKVQSFRLIMENNFIQMAASAGHVVSCTSGPIFKHIINRVQLYFTNGFTNIIL